MTTDIPPGYIYDAKGRVLTYLDKDTGYWEMYIHDDQNNRMTLKTSANYWGVYTYDEQGRAVTYKDSRGDKGYWAYGQYTPDSKRGVFTFLLAALTNWARHRKQAATPTHRSEISLMLDAALLSVKAINEETALLNNKLPPRNYHREDTP